MTRLIRLLESAVKAGHLSRALVYLAKLKTDLGIVDHATVPPLALIRKPSDLP